MARDRSAPGGAPRSRTVPDRAPSVHDRLAALPDDARPEPSATAPTDDPDPRFWGPEPRTVRRRGGAAAEVRPAHRLQPAWETLAARVRDLRVEIGIGALVVLVLAAAGGVVWYRMGLDAGEPPPVPSRQPAATAVTQPLPSGTGATPPPGRPGPRGASVVVHVAGAVHRPGVLEMPAGARVIDAVEGAGGGLPDADLDRLNLAARLVDGQRVLVAKVGAPAPPDPGPSGSPGASTGPIDLNAATAAQLEALPGIGPTLAAAILAERDRRGGFRSVNELREVRGIGEARFAELRARVTV